MLSLDDAGIRDTDSLQNWVNGNGSVAREETEYLENSRDLTRIAPLKDTGLERAEKWVEDSAIRCWRGFREVARSTL